MDEKFYTPYSKEEILNAFQRALGDLTNAQIFALVRNEAAARESQDENLAQSLAAETAARTAAEAEQNAVLLVLTDSAPKNAINAGTVTNRTINGITWTVNAEQGTVTANGTATGNSFCFLWASGTDVPFAYPTFLSGAPEGGSGTTHELQAAIGSVVYHDYGSGTEIPAGTIHYITCCVRSGRTVTDLVFRPMLCPSALCPDPPQYVPYCPTLPELYRMILDMQQERAAASSALARTAEQAADPLPETEAEDA